MADFKELAKMIFSAGYNYVGVRGLAEDEEYNVGDICRESYEWDGEYDCSTYYTTGKLAGGTCCTEILFSDLWDDEEDDLNELTHRIEEIVKKNAQYGDNGKHIIVGGDRSAPGCLDDGEIRIKSAVVMAIL